MSYTIDLIVGSLPENNKAAWAAIERLRETYYEDKREKASVLIALHSELTALYPCLCSYEDDDVAMGDCPWADGPMIDNFAHEMGVLAIVFSAGNDVVPFVIEKANALGITVADGQSEEIFRPGDASLPVKSKSWWNLW